jgi:hypothetical protein
MCNVGCRRRPAALYVSVGLADRFGLKRLPAGGADGFVLDAGEDVVADFAEPDAELSPRLLWELSVERLGAGQLLGLPDARSPLRAPRR